MQTALFRRRLADLSLEHHSQGFYFASVLFCTDLHGKIIIVNFFLRYWSGSLKLPHEQQFNQFVNELGPGQKVSRQVLGSPYLGEIKLALYADRQKLNITILEVKNLKQAKNKTGLPCN